MKENKDAILAILEIKPLLCISNTKWHKDMKRPQIISRIKEALHRNEPGLQIVLFGSEARGDARADSDIDLLLLVDKEPVTLADKMALTAPLYDIELETGIQINPIVNRYVNGEKDLLHFMKMSSKKGYCYDSRTTFDIVVYRMKSAED